MFKTLSFLLYLSAVTLAYDTCRRKVSLSKGTTCGAQQTMYNEGECLCCYKDTKGIPTIGVGFNLERSDAAKVLSNYNLNLPGVLKDCEDKTTKRCLTQAQAEDIFNTITYPEAEQCVDSYAPGLPTVKRAAVVDVAFAGCSTLHGFVKMQAALKRKDWATAAAELKDSKWCGDVESNRCNSDYQCINEASCTGGICGTHPHCASRDDCFCFKTTHASAGFCATNYWCDDVQPCSASLTCPSSDICIVDSCCDEPVCVPLSHQCTYQNLPFIQKTKTTQRSVCTTDNDCEVGAVCKLHTTGRYCV